MKRINGCSLIVKEREGGREWKGREGYRVGENTGCPELNKLSIGQYEYAGR